MLTELESLLERVVDTVEIEEGATDDLTVVQATSEDNLDLTLAWNEDTNYLAGNLDCGREIMPGVIKVCNTIGQYLECGSIFMPSSLETEVMEVVGYEKQYVFPLIGQPKSTIDFAEVTVYAERFRSFLQDTLGFPVSFQCSFDDRPYIYSVDWQGIYRGKHKFSCYLHLHPLTQAAYLEEIVIPKPIRRHRLGSKVVAYLKHLVREINCRHLYLSAKRRAEGFWENQGFGYVFRANLRNENRRLSALRKTPGWDRTWFEGRRLEYDNWLYRNHPQDDYDLYLALRDQPLDGLDPVVLTAG